MRVALISSRYPPESSPGAKRASDLASSLRSAGHRVTVLTQLPNYPDPTAFGFEPPKGGGAVIEENDAENATWRFAPMLAAKGNLAGRLMAEWRFARRTSQKRTGLSDFDGVVASTPFVFNLLAARSYRLPMWLDVRDLTWEYARDLGSRSPAKTIGASVLRSLALSSLRAARGVSTTTSGQRQYLIDRGVSAEKIRVVPNGVPRSVLEELTRRSSSTPDRAGGPLKVVYAGLLGFPQGLEFVVESVEEIAGGEIELHLFGDGVDRKRLAEYCCSRHQRNVHVHGHISYDEYLGEIATADVLLASLRPEVQMAVPSKIFEYMAAGKPILFVGSGEGATAVVDAGAGLSVPYGDKRLLKERLGELSRDSNLRHELGGNGRQWVGRHRVREEINASWVREIEAAFGGAMAWQDAERRKKKPFRRVASLAARGAEVCGLVHLIERSTGGQADRLRVLAYHRVTESNGCSSPCPGLLSATPVDFAHQMEFVASNYRVLSVEDVLDSVRSGRSLPSRAVLLTFDDAYCDFAENAWPILRRQGLPVTLFVPTGFPGHPERSFWWDRLYQSLEATSVDRFPASLGSDSLRTPKDRLRSFLGLREWIKGLPHRDAMERVDRICQELGEGRPAPRVLGWSALRSLSREGVSLGAHTRTHPAVDRITVDEVYAEVSGSMDDLKREIGSALPIFAYPAGRYDDEAVRVVGEAGVELAFTTRGGVNDLHRADRLRLRRIHVGSGTTRPILRAQLAGVRPPTWSRR